MDPNVSNQLIMSWRGDVYRTSGYWLNGHFNSSRPWATGTYKFNYTSNELEKFFTYSGPQESYVPFPMIKMNFDGSLTDHGEYPLSQCDYHTLIRTSRSGNYAACWNGKIPSCRSSVNSFNGNYGFMSVIVLVLPLLLLLSGGCEIWGTETKFTETETNFTDFFIFGNRVRPIFTEAKPEIHEVPKEKNGSLSIIAIAGALLAIVYCPMSYLGRRLKYNRERYEQKWWKFLIIVIAIALVLPLLCYLCYLIWRNSKAKEGYYMESILYHIFQAWLLWNERKGLELIDPGLEDGSSSPNEVLRCIHVGLLCVQDQAIDRPTMSDVVSMLTNESLLLPAPKQPAFYVSDTNEVPEITEINSENCSTNNLTVSEIEAR
ncbi:hypothetical protein Patl1_34175 [Pistacia atlantica]|uniref:Uncharacterized protein n=1 Tax=Pistacia atlantica TaxID=434234 RepID=A0ACC0ZSC7_9ROSI|nr:hypothetical protein Patl1_34175 [Pistacia atlantica]